LGVSGDFGDWVPVVEGADGGAAEFLACAGYLSFG